MAKKQTERFTDITRTGAQSYRDLQNQNTLNPDEIVSFADAGKYFKYSGQSAIAANRAKIIHLRLTCGFSFLEKPTITIADKRKPRPTQYKITETTLLAFVTKLKVKIRKNK